MFVKRLKQYCSALMTLKSKVESLRCHLKPYAQKKENQLGAVAKLFAEKQMAVDKLHFRWWQFCIWLFCDRYTNEFTEATKGSTAWSPVTRTNLKSSRGWIPPCASRWFFKFASINRNLTCSLQTFSWMNQYTQCHGMNEARFFW